MGGGERGDDIPQPVLRAAGQIAIVMLVAMLLQFLLAPDEPAWGSFEILGFIISGVLIMVEVVRWMLSQSGGPRR